MSKYNWEDYKETDYGICLHCLFYQIHTFPDFLHSLDEMEEGPISSDRKCRHCWDTEEEFGRIKVSDEERKEVMGLYESIEEDRKKFFEENF